MTPFESVWLGRRAAWAAVAMLVLATVGCSENGRVVATAPTTVTAGAVRSTGPLAFTSTRDGSSFIYLADADGANATKLTAGSNPAWSNDGTRIAFETGPSSSSNLFVINVDGSGLRSLGKGSQASWSPDDSKIAFALPSAYDGIYVMNVDGSGRTRVATAGFRSDADGLLNPVWSPDGQTIAFVASNWDEPRQICVVKLDGSAPRVLVGGSDVYEQSDPSWSPDGSSLVFTSILTVTTVRADGTGWQSSVNGEAYNPDWAGGDFVFSRFLSGWGPGSPMRLFIGRGSAVRQLVPDAPGVTIVYWDHEPAYHKR